MKKQKIYEKGITLIALVITIIVLLILAGITLRIVMNGGIINKSQTAVDKYTEESAREKLSVTVLAYKMGTLTGEAGEIEGKKHLNEYITEIGGQLTEAEDSKYYEVELDGYLFWVNKETLEIISKGPSNPVPPTKIKFSSDTEEAYIGEGKIFSLEKEPQNASMKYLKWSVDNEEIATIQNGVLTGKKEGTVKVTVTSTEDANVTATCTVTIKAIELTGITLNKTETTIGMEKTEKLEITYEPTNATYKDITWSTSNATIATVENGTITGKKAGTATITATSTKNANIKAECNVTVEEILEISTVEELKAFRDDVNNGTSYAGKKVVLVNDLDLNSGKYTVSNDGTVTFNENAEQWTAIGTDANKFAGTFDGQGHTISGLYINKPTERYQGLFGCARGDIKNIILKNVNIQGGPVTGGICGYAMWVDINKCAVYGNITVYGQTYGNGTPVAAAGGIAGSVDITNINNCYNFATINAGNESGMIRIGGIVGDFSCNAKINNCYNKGRLNGTSFVGGIVGSSDANSDSNREISNCYNLANLNGKQGYCGEIIAYLRYKIKIDNCYNTGILNGTSTYKGGIIGDIYNDSENDITINNCSYLTGTATAGIGYTADSSLSIEPSNDLPSVLSVINGDNAFTTDSEGNIVLKFEN